MANTRKHNGLICLIIVLGALLHNTGAAQDQSVGEDVILQPKYSGVPSEIIWRKDDMKVVQMILSPQEEITYYFLEDRADINRTNGVLTIKNLTMKDRGLFVAEVLVNDNSQYTTIFLNIYVPRPEYKTEKDDVTLKPLYTGDPSGVKWTVNGSLLVEMSLKPREEIIFYRFQDRATISPTDGSLTIRKLTIEDSGMYKAQVMVNDIIQETGIKVTVSKYISLSGGIIALIVFPLVFLAVIFSIIIIFCVLWKCYRKNQRVRKFVQEVCKLFPWYKDQLLVRLVGSEVTMKPQCIGDPSEIHWKKDGKKLVDLEDPIQYRMTIDGTNGSLTIRDLTLQDSGLYKAEVLVNNAYQYTTIKLTVQAQSLVRLVGSEVTMKTECIGDPSEIRWKKDGKKLVDLELNPPEDPIFYRLQDRATIDRSNGSLTIKKMIVEDSGIYRAEVLVNDVYQYTKIPLAVQERCQCITVKFHPKMYPCLTIHNVMPEDRDQYVLEVLQVDEEKYKELNIKETDGIVDIRTEGDRVTLTWPDTGKMSNITWKKNSVTLFHWKGYGLKIHTKNITLESGFVTVNDAEGSRLYKVEVHTNHINNTLQPEANNQGNESSTNREAGCEAVEMVPLTDNGPPERQPIDSIRFHPEYFAEKKMTWKKDGQLLKIDGKRIKSGLCGELTINNVTPDDKGTYTCQCKGQDQKQEFILL